MPFQLDHRTEPGTCKVVYTGAVTIEDRARALDAILDWLREPGHKRVLVDLRNAWAVDGPMDACQRHASNLAREYTDLKGARFAYLSKPDCAVVSLAEQMAAVRGYFFQRFTDEASALRWLR